MSAFKGFSDNEIRDDTGMTIVVYVLYFDIYPFITHPGVNWM